MEGLKKLEKVQTTIELLHSHRISSSSNTCCNNNNNADSDRFLANIVLLLIQPCGQLDLNTKGHLISEHLPKITSAFLEEAFLCLNGVGTEQVDSTAVYYHENKAASLMGSFSEEMDMVRLDSMQRANSTLEDFCKSYFMFHEMDVKRPESIFKYLPILTFTESYIYQLDTMNEQLVQMSANGIRDLDKESDMEASCNFWLIKQLRTDPFWPLANLLEHHGLLTERIQEEFRCGQEYWDLERKLCNALARNEEISVDDVTRASHLKSFDYRVLNFLLYQLRGQKVNDLHMEFLSISEFLVEVSDDLFDYEDDVLENNFNILRMFVRIYGASEAPRMLAKHISKAEEKYSHLLSTLEPKLSINYQKRCEEATKEGGMLSGPRLGRWSIPPVIVNENLYRSKISYSKPSVEFTSKTKLTISRF